MQAEHCMQYQSHEGKGIHHAPASLRSAPKTATGTAMVPFLTGGMRPLTSWWKNVVEGAWLESFVEQSLRHSPGLLLSLGINYIKVLNFYLI